MPGRKHSVIGSNLESLVAGTIRQRQCFVVYLPGPYVGTSHEPADSDVVPCL